MRIRKLFHFSVTLFYLYVTYRGLEMLFYPANSYISSHPVYIYGFNNKEKYFSIWVSGLQLIYFILVSIIEMPALSSKICKRNISLQKFQQCFYMALIFPLTLYIFITFWGFYLIDRDLIYPEIFDKFIPPWLNQAMHSAPVVIILLHGFTIDIDRCPSRKSSVRIISTFMAIYAIIFLWSVFIHGNWIYFMFNYMTSYEIALFMTGSYFFCILLLMVGYYYISYLSE